MALGEGENFSSNSIFWVDPQWAQQNGYTWTTDTYTFPANVDGVDDPTLLEEVKEFLVELLHSDDLTSDDMEKFLRLKAVFELEREEFELAAKRIKLAESILRKKVNGGVDSDL